MYVNSGTPCNILWYDVNVKPVSEYTSFNEIHVLLCSDIFSSFPYSSVATRTDDSTRDS